MLVQFVRLVNDVDYMRGFVAYVTLFMLGILSAFIILIRGHYVKASAKKIPLHLPISSQTACGEVMKLLAEAGCQDITNRIDACSRTKRYVIRGGFGHIYQGYLQDGTEIAIKCLETLEQECLINGHKLVKRTAREVFIWSRCSHPNVLPLLGVAWFQGYIAMVSPWQSNGRLDAYISTCSLSRIFDLCIQLAEGLVYIHSQGIVHGDIKSANIVVSSKGVPMFTDFGNSIIYNGRLQFTGTNTSAYSIPWAAPEILHESTGCTVEADVYAFGMVILEILSGKAPYGGKSGPATIYAIMSNKKVPSRADHPMAMIEEAQDEIWRLLERCWASDPNRRPTASRILDELKSIRTKYQPLLS